MMALPKTLRVIINQLFSCVHAQSVAPPLLVQALESDGNSLKCF